MPTYVFTCDNGHTVETFKPTPYQRNPRRRCKECGLYLRRDYVREHSVKQKEIHLDYDKDPISHLVNKRSFKGVTIENLTPNPVRVTSKEQYMKLLRDTHSREKHS